MDGKGMAHLFFKKRILFRKEYFYPLGMRGQPNYANAATMGLNGIPPLHLRVITSGPSPSLKTGYFYPMTYLAHLSLRTIRAKTNCPNSILTNTVLLPSLLLLPPAYFGWVSERFPGDPED
jgi:hypothetical protein